MQPHLLRQPECLGSGTRACLKPGVEPVACISRRIGREREGRKPEQQRCGLDRWRDPMGNILYTLSQERGSAAVRGIADLRLDRCT